MIDDTIDTDLDAVIDMMNDLVDTTNASVDALNTGCTTSDEVDTNMANDAVDTTNMTADAVDTTNTITDSVDTTETVNMSHTPGTMEVEKDKAGDGEGGKEGEEEREGVRAMEKSTEVEVERGGEVKDGREQETVESSQSQAATSDPLRSEVTAPVTPPDQEQQKSSIDKKIEGEYMNMALHKYCVHVL